MTFVFSLCQKLTLLREMLAGCGAGTCQVRSVGVSASDSFLLPSCGSTVIMHNSCVSAWVFELFWNTVTLSLHLFVSPSLCFSISPSLGAGHHHHSHGDAKDPVTGCRADRWEMGRRRREEDVCSPVNVSWLTNVLSAKQTQTDHRDLIS